MPFTAAALDQSVTARLDDEVPPDCSEGYALWREAYEKGEAGAFSIPVAEAIDAMKVTIESPDRQGRDAAR